MHCVPPLWILAGINKRMDVMVAELKTASVGCTRDWMAMYGMRVYTCDFTVQCY